MAARVSGDLVIRAVFASDGSVSSVQVVSGPALTQMREAAATYVRSWHVNEGARERECLITISFRIEGDPDCYFKPSSVTMTDTQHFIVSAKPIWTCDPSATMSFVRHRFLLFHWDTNEVRHVNE
jgi:hypothetical protein